MDAAEVDRWVAGYERLWRTSGTGELDRLFGRDVSYLPSPWRRPIVGRDALARFWESERDGPDEEFVMRHRIVAIDGTTAVISVEVDYGDADGSRWRDMWVVEFDADGRCAAFEEWPFAPAQPDGHGDWP